MAKESLNIIDFSGGINSLDDKRDILDNQIVQSDSLISYSSGNIKLAGGFVVPSNFGLSEGGYNSNSTRDGLNVVSYFNPSYGFRILNKATVTVSSDIGTFTLVTNSSHALTTGTYITVYKASDLNWVDKVFQITQNTYNTFTAINISVNTYRNIKTKSI